jgi:hypothetical protein
MGCVLPALPRGRISTTPGFMFGAITAAPKLQLYG